MSDERVQVLLRLRSTTTGEWRAPAELRPLLAREAEELDTSLADVIARILSETYGVGYAANSRKTAPSEDGDILKVSLPSVLYDAVAHAAVGGRRSPQDEALAALSAHYGLRLPVRAKRRRRRVRPATA